MVHCLFGRTHTREAHKVNKCSFIVQFLGSTNKPAHPNSPVKPTQIMTESVFHGCLHIPTFKWVGTNRAMQPALPLCSTLECGFVAPHHLLPLSHSEVLVCVSEVVASNASCTVRTATSPSRSGCACLSSLAVIRGFLITSRLISLSVTDVVLRGWPGTGAGGGTLPGNRN